MDPYLVPHIKPGWNWLGMQKLRQDRHWEESCQEDDAPNAISAWKSKDSSKDRKQMGRNNGKPGRKAPITGSKKGKKIRNSSQRRTYRDSNTQEWRPV